MSRGRRIGLALLAAVLLPALAVAALAVFVNSDGARAQLADAVRRSTGRELAIAGPIELGWSGGPTLTLDDVSLSNPPGMSRPDMARLARVEVQVAVAPLLSRRVEVRSVTLLAPDVLLERDAAGSPNWVFEPPVAAAPEASGTPAAAPSPRIPVSVDAVRVSDGRIGWGPGGVVLLVPALTAAAAGPDAPVAVSGRLNVAGVSLDLAGMTGPLAAFGAAAWPIEANLTGRGLRLEAKGALGPDAGIALSATVADLAALGPATGRALPPLRDVQGSARVTAAGVSAIEVAAGAADVSAWWPGLRLSKMRVAAPGMAQPVTLSAEGLAGTAPVAVAANAGSLSALLGGGPVPVQALLAAAGATVGGQGSIADLTGRGLDMAISARVPDLAALGGAAGTILPPWRDVAFDARASATPAGGLSFRAMRIVTPHGDLAGDVVLGRDPRPSLRGTLVSQRLDLDAVLALAQPVPPPAPAPAASATPAPPAAAAPAAAPAAGAPTYVLSDAPLPFAALLRADADLRVTLGEAVWRRSTYHAVDGRVLLQDGRLRIDPLQAQMPGGGLQALVLADASGAVPTVALGLQAPGLDAGPMLALFGAPPLLPGRVDADLQLKGRGNSLRQIGATLDGYVGLAMVEGELDNRWLAGLLGGALRGLPFDLNGRSAVRCLALRFDVAGGRAVARSLLLDASRLRLEGEGEVSLANEMLDLRLRSLVRLGATAVSVPVHLVGPWRAPRPQVAGGGALVIGAPPAADTCPAQLTLARNGRAGPMPPTADAASIPRSTRPADLLRSFLR